MRGKTPSQLAKVAATFAISGCTTVIVTAPDSTSQPTAADAITDSFVTDSVSITSPDQGVVSEADVASPDITAQSTDTQASPDTSDATDIADDPDLSPSDPCDDPRHCDDGVACTVDTCHAGGSCMHTQDPTLCYAPACSAAFCDLVKGCQVATQHHTPGCP